jgi:zinc and cadmium transporter
VLLHEIPQEIGDFGILIHSGMPVKKALAFNFLSALTALLGVAFELAVESRIKGFSNYLIPITAGGFLYIASSDLIPQLHRDHEAKLSTSFLQLISIVLGVGVMTLLVFIE